MSNYFADTSTIAKRYIPEIGSGWVQSWVVPQTGNTIVISRLTTVEFISAISRRQREMTISTKDFTTLRGAFLRDVNTQYIVINLTKPIFANAQNLVTSHALRTLDAIQLACALRASRLISTPLIFVSADVKLLAAATAEGLAVDNPNAHP